MKWFSGVFMGIFAAFGMLIFTFIAWAQEVVPPETVDQAVGWLPKLIEAVVKGDYLVAGGVGLMVLMVIVRQYLLPNWKLSADVFPLVVALISGLAMAGLSMTNAVPFGDAVVSGLKMALLAGGAWDLIGKYLFKLLLGDKLSFPKP